MTAEDAAIRARDPDRVMPPSPKTPASNISTDEDGSKHLNIGNDLETTNVNDASRQNETSGQNQTSRLSKTSESPFATYEANANPNNTSTDLKKSTLPPEILGMFRETTKRKITPAHSRQVSGLKTREENGTRDKSSHSSDSSSGAEPQDHVIERAWKLATMDSCPIIMLPRSFQAKEGTKLTDDLIVGKHLSSGLQGGVYDLLNLDGSKAKVVFKLVHTHALLAEVEREWEVGMRLNQLADPDGSLPGFMGVGAGIRGNGKFRGMLLERLHGTTVDKVICTREFHDVQYVYNMLYSVFTALDRAQGALGFHHSDLRLANVMEITPVTDEEEREHGKIDKTASEEIMGRDSVSTEASQADQKIRHQFKIIDYGLANFEETFAAGPDVILEDEMDRHASRRSINLQRQNSISPATGCVAAFHLPMVKKDRLGALPSTSPIEKLYRFMWRRKGDVYHLVFELGEWLDGRIWPAQDELDVLRLVDLIHHVTGVRMKYWFASEITGQKFDGGLRDAACGCFERHDSAMHFLRRWDIRLRSWLNPSNPGLTAAEALTAPFFTKRISLRGVIHGCSTRYSKWTKIPSRRKKKTSTVTTDNAQGLPQSKTSLPQRQE